MPKKMAEAYGNRTHLGLIRPHDGFEDREHHQELYTSEEHLSEDPSHKVSSKHKSLQALFKAHNTRQEQ